MFTDVIAKAHNLKLGDGIELENKSGYDIVVFRDGNPKEFKYHFLFRVLSWSWNGLAGRMVTTIVEDVRVTTNEQMKELLQKYEITGVKK